MVSFSGTDAYVPKPFLTHLLRFATVPHGWTIAIVCVCLYMFYVILTVCLSFLSVSRKEHRNYSSLTYTVYSMCVCVCFLPIHSEHQVRWTYQPGSHRRKVTQDF